MKTLVLVILCTICLGYACCNLVNDARVGFVAGRDAVDGEISGNPSITGDAPPFPVPERSATKKLRRISSKIVRKRKRRGDWLSLLRAFAVTLYDPTCEGRLVPPSGALGGLGRYCESHCLYAICLTLLAARAVLLAGAGTRRPSVRSAGPMAAADYNTICRKQKVAEIVSEHQLDASKNARSIAKVTSFGSRHCNSMHSASAEEQCPRHVRELASRLEAYLISWSHRLIG